MSKREKNDEAMEVSGLQAYIDAAERKRLRDGIVDVKKAILETERVLTASTPKIIQEIADHVKNCQKVFVTLDHPTLAPELPPEYAKPFQVPTEITAPRERAYFLDRDGYLRELNCEIRQEYQKGFYKQTVKVGETGKKHDSTMDREEQASKLRGFGFNVYAVGDREIRKNILENASSPLKPVLRMVSQRNRISYHPEGNPDIQIEMALEPVHFGETFTGHRWFMPKIDLEIKVAPSHFSTGMRHSILAREEDRLLKIFPLTRQLVSSPTAGFEEIKASMANDETRAKFDALGNNEAWWKNKPVAQRLIA